MKFFDVEKTKFTYSNFTKRKNVTPFYVENPPYMDITFCVDGELDYIYEGEHITVKAGDAVVFLPHVARERLAGDKPAYYSSINVILDSEFDYKSGINGHIKDCVNATVIKLLETFSEDYITVSPRRNEKCASSFFYLYYYLVEKAHDKENVHVQAIKQYIADNLSKKITLDDIADTVHLAPQYICNLFKKETGSTITEFIINQRIDRAKLHITTYDDPIHKIAEGCGFTDYNYFSHTFKKIVGISAASYRKTRKKLTFL